MGLLPFVRAAINAKTNREGQHYGASKATDCEVNALTISRFFKTYFFSELIKLTQITKWEMESEHSE